MDVQKPLWKGKRKELMMKLEIHESNKQQNQKRNLRTDCMKRSIEQIQLLQTHQQRRNVDPQRGSERTYDQGYGAENLSLGDQNASFKILGESKKPFHALTFQGEPEQSALQENPPPTPQGCQPPFHSPSLPPFLFWF